MSWIDSALGIQPEVLKLRSQRSSALAANIANAGTPGFKARDYDFQNILRNIAQGASTSLQTTHSGHMKVGGNGDFGSLFYRVPTKSSINGNTVEAEVEQAAFAENALRYQASLQFLDGAFSGLRLAIRGQ